MNLNRIPASRLLSIAAVAAIPLAPMACWAEAAGTYKGEAVSIGKGSAHTVVRTDARGKPVTIGVVFTETALDGLPAPTGADKEFEYVLPMPQGAPKTVIDHVVINWNPAGHPPPKVYDVPHFDFHFYLVSRHDREMVHFNSDAESGDASQQPAAEHLPAGYVVPPGTAVSKMGVHAINPAAPEFNGKPFTATFIHGYHQKQHTFLEPMVTMDFLKSKPTFSAPVSQPQKHTKSGAYPSRYSVNYDKASKSYQVLLEGLK